MKFSLSLFLVLSSLCMFANSQIGASYPGCVSSACAGLQTVGLTCGYDFASDIDATQMQTKCICARPDSQAAIQQCLNCAKLSDDPQNGELLVAVCTFTFTGLSSTATPTASSSSSSSSSTPGNPNKTSTPASSGKTVDPTSPASSATPASETTSIESSSTSNSLSTTSSSSTRVPLIGLPQTTSSSAAASHMTPVIGFAALLLVAQVAL